VEREPDASRWTALNCWSPTRGRHRVALLTDRDRTSLIVYRDERSSCGASAKHLGVAQRFGGPSPGGHPC